MILSIKAISLKCLAKELNSMEFVVNEVKHVENLLKDKKVTPRKVMKELRLIVQYYLSKGYTKEETVELTVQFMNDVNGNSSGEKWRKRIESTANDIISKQDYELRDIEEIHITNSELEVIKTLSSELEQKYAFGLLVYCKIWNYKKQGKFVRIESTTNFAKNVEVNAKAKDRELLFNRLQEKGLINVPRKTGSDSIEVLYVNYTDEVGITIPLEDIDKFIYYYYQWSNKGKIKRCEVCGELILTTSNRSKYCKPCAKATNIKKTNEKK